MSEPEETAMTVRSLWAQFLPLSLSEVTMAAGEPLITTTLAHLPEARVNLAAAGVAKSLAVFFESPIIMLLHASNALSATMASRRALFRFMMIALAVLTGGLLLLASPPSFALFGRHVLRLDGAIGERAQVVLLLLILWPAAIGWRRYFQGRLIRAGHAKQVGRAGLARLAVVAAVLAVGFATGMPGAWLAGTALILGVISEALMVTAAARDLGAAHAPQTEDARDLPTDVAGVFRFYWPLASSMLVVWGGRAILVALVARARDASVALAAWPAAWGFVLLIANTTRMVQQVIIRNRDQASDGLLVRFALSVGAPCTLLLLGVAVTSPGRLLLSAFIGHDAAILAGVLPVVLLCSVVPMFIALQNAAQGFLISEGRTSRVNVATWLGTTVLLGAAAFGIRAEMPGATAAAVAMLAALAAELLWLSLGLRQRAQQAQAR
ncbi:hypothetical protein WME76_38930 [Sorangium sp. So ce119]|uniref:hypothetical protein n=1 Tax=Sorangium sp. So ce119 TaxID=3133279 RepID=UPI003F5EE8AE